MSGLYELDKILGIDLELKDGTAWALYFDDGPGGPSGQSMRTTCPHAVLHVWDNEQKMKKDMQHGLGRNKRARVMCGVVGEWTSGGVFGVVIHGAEGGEA